MKKKVPSKVEEIRQFKATVEAGAKSVSFSQLSLYVTCPHRWYRAYVKKEAPYSPSIHTVFGTALHETMQTWLEILYTDSVKASNEFDYREFLLTRMKEIYKKEREVVGSDFSTSEELSKFYDDGLNIMDYVLKNRKAYFSSKNVYLVGCEIPILYKMREKFYFKGFIDFLLYDEDLDTWTIYDIKTSTSGWSAETKKDFTKISQVLLYKSFLSKQFGIDQDKIKVEYFIVKRQVPEEADFPAMRRRVQEFRPSDGKVNVKKAFTMVETFMQGALTDTGEYQDREYEATPSEASCKYCLFKDSCEFRRTSK